MTHKVIVPQPSEIAMSAIREDGYEVMECRTPTGVRMLAGGVFEPYYWVEDVPPTYLLVSAPETFEADGYGGISVELCSADGLRIGRV